jgi:hypothetical protein
MPYIKKVARDFYHFDIKNLIEKLKTVNFPAGDVNYILTNIIGAAYQNNPSYQTINDMVGALEGAKIEFYRKVGVPHEELKISENGDVDIYQSIGQDIAKKRSTVEQDKFEQALVPLTQINLEPKAKVRRKVNKYIKKKSKK